MFPQYQLSLPPKVKQEIDEICAYVAARSLRGAETVAKEIDRTLELIRMFPYSNPVYENRRDPSLTVRDSVALQYKIYYRINETAKIINVLTVRHGARRQPRRFP